jgi:hypothetical protein
MATAFAPKFAWWRWWLTIPESALAHAKAALQRRLLPLVGYIDPAQRDARSHCRDAPSVETPLRATPFERALAGLPSVSLLEGGYSGAWFDRFLAEPYVTICEDCTRVLWDESVSQIVAPHGEALKALHAEITRIWPSICVVSSDERLRPFLGRPGVMNSLSARIVDASKARLEQALLLLDAAGDVAVEHWHARARESLARGESIKALLVVAGLKQNEIARAMHAAPSTVSRIVNGELPLQRERLLKVCCHLLRVAKSKH